MVLSVSCCFKSRICCFSVSICVSNSFLKSSCFLTSSNRSTTPLNFYGITAGHRYSGSLRHNRGLGLEVGQLIAQRPTFRRETRVFFAVIDHFLLPFDWTRVSTLSFRGERTIWLLSASYVSFSSLICVSSCCFREAFHRSLRWCV